MKFFLPLLTPVSIYTDSAFKMSPLSIAMSGLSESAIIFSGNFSVAPKGLLEGALLK